MLLSADCPTGLPAGASLEFPRILVIAREQSDRSNLGILEFASFYHRYRKAQRADLEFLKDCFASLAMTKILEFHSFLQPIPQIPKSSKILEFLREF
ncbi:hypothetical protein [Campylobacter sp.]|uniref:hypothetical protein n=1 Tax=Campylobacter sp. TaxID=205 RepID=UPI002A5298F4|nr:hypothetical protein [Campylobacter sp.]MDD7090701.1 hypothetical protein [Campylobacteraceae bacterium]